MRLTDENVRGIKDDMQPGYFIEPCDIPPCHLIHALATELIESRAEIAKMRKELRVWEDAFATGRLGLAAARAALGRDAT